jgi:hypothetical protein
VNKPVEYFNSNPPDRRGEISPIHLVLSVLTFLVGCAGVALMCGFMIQAGRPVSIVFLILTALLVSPGAIAMYMGIVLMARRKPID